MHFFQAGRLVEEVTYAQLEGALAELETKMSRHDLLIVDDFALSLMKKQELIDQFEVIEDHSAQSSTLMIAHRAPEEWYEYVRNPLLADALIDCIRSRAHFLRLEGKSMR